METVNFYQIDTFRTPVFKKSGLTITGSADVTNDRFCFSGVGVFGGWQNHLIDGSESVTFSFDRGAATNISYEVGLSSEAGSSVNGIQAEGTISAFGVSGNFLGTQRISGREVNVSALFNNEPISAFQLRGNGDVSAGFNVESLTFTPGFSNITVDLLDDENDGDFTPGDISLREAIFAASDGGTVNFDPSLAGSTISEGIASQIALTLGEIVIDKNLTINGLGANKLTISGSNESRIFRIGGNTQVNINGLTLADGFSQEDGGAIDNRGILNLSNSTIRDSIASDDGGGINNLGTLRLNNSTLRNNIAEDDGGGIGNFGGTVEASNSTFSGNVAQSDGGGIFNLNGTVQLVSSTLTNNAVDQGNGGGIRSFQGTTTVNNTIIAGNFDNGQESPDVDGRFTSNGFNLIGIGDRSTGFSNGINGDRIGTIANPIDPRLTPLRNNGGATPTHALLINSPAIDRGDRHLAGTDQRGVSRPQGSSSDIGAVEFEFFKNLTVDNAIDEFDGDLSQGDVSLREAIFATAAGGTIDFASSLTGLAIALNLGTLTINKNLTIKGLGADNLTLDGNNTFRIFSIDSRAQVNISGLTLTKGGNPTSDGSAVFNAGTLNLSDSVIRDSRGRFAGGILNFGDLTVTNSTIRKNQEEEGEGGSGINNADTLTVINSTIEGNLGGGINNRGASMLTVTNSTINANVGSGISNAFNAKLTVTNSTISNNNGSDGGGIRNSGTLNLNNSTISGNKAGFGGGIFNDLSGTFTITNSTIANNTARQSGGGIFRLGPGGSIPVTTPQVGNSIIAGNISTVTSDVDGNFTSNGFNLIGNGNGSSGFTNGVNGDIVGTIANPIAPQLSPLQNNGGSTLTHVPLPSSLAIDNGDPNVTGIDQRGISRPAGLGVDIGAVEVHADNLTVSTLNDEFDGDFTPGDVSLREAIFLTNAGGTIHFADSLAGGTIALNLGELAIAKNLTIQGLGANSLTISGNNTSRVFKIDDGDQNNRIDVAIDGLTITNGTTSGDGGAIFNSENVTINNTTITFNTANNGGGIFNIGNATVSSSTIDSNVANSHGGGILNRGNLSVDRSTIFANLALSEGGGINNDGGTLSVTNSTINSNVGQTYSGAIDNDRGTATIINSTISDNFAENFGGIAAYLANTTVINSTITANIANGNGNGLFNGIGSTTTVTNSIVAGNWNNNDVGAIASFTSGGNNLIGNGDGVSGFTNGLNGDIVGTAANPIDPLIGSWQDNGGATFTHALLPGSPAIDAGNNSNAPTTDQRGIIRPQDGDFNGSAIVDIGAFELVGNSITSFDPVVTGGSAQSGFSNTPSSTLRDDLLLKPNPITADNLGVNLTGGNTTELLFG